MKNKNNILGFTLVELLAVIVLLAVIAIVTIPIIKGVIENVKRGSVKSSANGLIRAADMYYAKNIDKISDKVEFEINNGVQVSEAKLDYKGSISMGYLMLFKDNKKAICVDNGTYAARKSVSDKKVVVEKGICTGEWDEETKSYVISETPSSFYKLSVRTYEKKEDFIDTEGNENDIAIISDVKVSSYYVSNDAPDEIEEGMIWVVENSKAKTYLKSESIKVGIAYVMQYVEGEWINKDSYVYNNSNWEDLYYVEIKDGVIDIENSKLKNEKIITEYGYTGHYEKYVAVFSGYYNIELWGAAGASYGAGAGYGAYTSGDIYLNSGDTLYFYVGGVGGNTAGGWNGGGDGYNGSYQGRGGGGATDVRLVSTSSNNVWNEFESLKSRIMVAAGGGGSSYYNGNHYGSGGPAGGLYGHISKSHVGYGNIHYGTGATQSSGGVYNLNSALYYGGFGYGGNSGKNYESDGGGGGGYYGGGGAYDIGGGGGGSSYISGHAGCSSIDIKLSTSIDKIVHTGNPYHESGYYFINDVMIDGLGYSWTDKMGNQINMPNSSHTGMISGNSGNGYAKITIKNTEVKTKTQLELEKNKKIIYTFDYSGINYNSGNYQKYTAPHSGYYNVELWGAQGGTTTSGHIGGFGGYTKGKIYLNKNQVLYVYVGGTSTYTQGGWNGGGDGYNGSYQGRGGGGATDIRLTPTTGVNVWNEFESLKSRIMVASGGGGASYYDGNHYGTGGSGGALNGLISQSKVGYGTFHYGTGASQSTGGSFIQNSSQYVGGFGYGANSGKNNEGDGGGGGGYYGGGGAYDIGGGGGGSSYISGHAGCSSIDLKLSIDSNKIIHTGSPYHESNFFFTETTMTANVREGLGKAVIQLVSVSLKDERQKDDKYYTYYYSGPTMQNGNYQIFKTPKDGKYYVELWGAQGGSNSYVGGNGGYTAGEINLKTNTNLYLYLGGFTYTIDAGWNGGGTGYNGSSYSGRGGGGSTDIRTVKTSEYNIWKEVQSLKSRIMVAAGGGGASYYDGNHYGSGGPAGGLNGLITQTKAGFGTNHYGTGGTQISGGYYINNSSQFVGGFGYGSDSGKNNESDGGAGSGWYGGGGAYDIGGGGGGSSYISGHAGCIGVDSSGNPKSATYSKIEDSISFTGYKFDNTVMIDGMGYKWTTSRESIYSGTPSMSGNGVSAGNSGSGMAKITYLGN